MQSQSVFEREVAGLIVEVLNLDEVDAPDIDPDELLFGDGLALDSIDALELALAISQKYSVQFSADDENVKDIFASLRTLSAYIASHKA